MAWIKRSRKKEKELAQKKLQELNKMDEEFLAEYTEKDLEGLKVSHGLDALAEGEDQILTLKDSRILDFEEDALHNEELAGHEKTKKNNELKIKKRDYTGYDDDEFKEGGIAAQKKKVLAKYDEDDESIVQGFRLGAAAVAAKTSVIGQEEEETAVVNRALLNIDYKKNLEMSDYLQEGDVGFKKPKTKKKRPSRRAPVDLELDGVVGDVEPESMTLDPPEPSKRVVDLDVNFVDDDELQIALAKERREKMKRKVKMDPAAIARQVAAERQAFNAENGDDDGTNDGDGPDEPLIFDDTSEFVRSIVYDPTQTTSHAPRRSEPETKEAADDASVKSEASYELEAGEVDMKEEDDDESGLHLLQMDVDRREEPVRKEEGVEELGTASEQTYGTGLGNTLALLRQSGVLKAPTAERIERERIQRDRDRWLLDHRMKEINMENDRTRRPSGREYENRRREQEEQRMMVESFKDYKPDVNIVYYDDHGRELTAKESWKALSHRFHGKGSGKAKTEKRLKKIEEEKKMEAMVSGETPLSMNKAFQTRQEKAGQAHMVLSVGNRGAAPRVADFLDVPLSKKSDRKGKKKGQGNTEKMDGDESKGIASPATGAVISAPPTATSPLPGGVVKSGFARIAPTSEPTSGISSPADGSTADRAKFAFGLKRKAIDDDGNSTSQKRR